MVEHEQGHDVMNRTYFLVRVNGSAHDTHAAATLREAVDLAMPDETARLEVSEVQAPDAGAARLIDPPLGWAGPFTVTELETRMAAHDGRSENEPVVVVAKSEPVMYAIPQATEQAFPMRGTFEVSEDMLVNLLVSAREGGSNYWCRFDECPYKEVFKVGQEFGEWHLNLPARVSELPEDLGRASTPHVIDRAALQRGIDLLAKKAPGVLASILRDDADAEDGDVFLQLCLLGEVVYG